MNVAVPAVDEAPKNSVKPPNPKLVVPPLLMKVAVLALDEAPSKYTPLLLLPPGEAPVLVKVVMLPTVALAPSKNIKLELPPTLPVTKFCVIPELFVMPGPATVN